MFIFDPLFILYNKKKLRNTESQVPHLSDSAEESRIIDADRQQKCVRSKLPISLLVPPPTKSPLSFNHLSIRLSRVPFVKAIGARHASI